MVKESLQRWTEQVDLQTQSFPDVAAFSSESALLGTTGPLRKDAV